MTNNLRSCAGPELLWAGAAGALIDSLFRIRQGFLAGIDEAHRADFRKMELFEQVQPRPIRRLVNMFAGEQPTSTT
jgi:hypothetical protein